MKVFPLVILFSSACVIALLTSCGSSGSGAVSENIAIRGYNPGVGPFNTNGDYVEAWADDKRKGNWWRKSIVTADKTTKVAKKSSKPKYSKPSKPKYKAPVIAAAAPKPKVPVYKAPTYKAPKYKAPQPKAVAKAKPTPRPKPKAKPVAKPVVKTVKVKPKRKPPIRYVARSRDTLWSISQKYKTSVSAIKAANGLKSNSVYAGKVLLIPQY